MPPSASENLIPLLKPRPLKHQAPRIKNLLSRGFSTVEVTLRHPEALDWLKQVTREFPSLEIWAGTVTKKPQVKELADMGVHTVVSPGYCSELVTTILDLGLTPIPGVATPSEVMAATRQGLTRLKVFPAAPLGGPSYIKALGGPFPEVRFIATGGINQENYQDYLKLANVDVVAGSFLDSTCSD